MSRELCRRTCDPGWLVLLLAAAIFFLPLHFHVSSAAAQVSKECICLQGSRTLATLTHGFLLSSPPLPVYILGGDTHVEFWVEPLRIPSSRAPPRAVSL